jgi:hypothetical protein
MHHTKAVIFFKGDIALDFPCSLPSSTWTWIVSIDIIDVPSMLKVPICFGALAGVKHTIGHDTLWDIVITIAF